jgi:oligoribonuclease NrnB/cAMP/cGMP phosphodiesterase (DHH superfamily)
MSHTDLDGYGCQLVSKKIFPNGFFYNANYGLEVKSTLATITKQFESIEEDIFFLISDLNLTLEESKHLNKHINILNESGKTIKLQLLDHHGSGEPSSKKFDWYYLDTSRSATKIVFDYFMENYKEFDSLCSDNFKLLIEAIDDVDIWHESDPYFEFGKVAMRTIYQTGEINSTLFPNESRKYKHFLLNKAQEYITKENGHILLDDDLHKLKKEFLNLSNTNDTLDNHSANYLVHLLHDRKEDLTVYYKDKKGLLTFTLSNISIPANTFLKANPDYDFFININRRGNAGLRAANNIDVSILANKLADGGGHPNASGAYFKDFKETIFYSDVKNFLQEKLNRLD